MIAVIVRVPTLLMTTVLLVVALDAQATNGYFSDGSGIKAEGVAAAEIAFPQDSLTIATSPAGLSVPDPGLDIGADVYKRRRTSMKGFESFSSPLARLAESK